jgi:hypothetical protein
MDACFLRRRRSGSAVERVPVCVYICVCVCVYVCMYVMYVCMLVYSPPQEKWKSEEADWEWISDQFKAVRQDMVIQVAARLICNAIQYNMM